MQPRLIKVLVVKVRRYGLMSYGKQEAYSTAQARVFYIFLIDNGQRNMLPDSFK